MRSFVIARAVVWCAREARGASTPSLEDGRFVARRRRTSSRSTASFVRCVCSTASHARFFVSSFLRFFVRSFVDAMDRLCGDFLELVVDVVFDRFFIRRRRRRRRARRQRRSYVLFDDVRGPRSNVDGFEVVLFLSKSGERRRCASLELKRDVVGFAERVQTRVAEFLQLGVPSEFSLAHAQTRASVHRRRRDIVRSRTTRATLIVERAGGCFIEERVAMRLRAHV